MREGGIYIYIKEKERRGWRENERGKREKGEKEERIEREREGMERERGDGKREERMERERREWKGGGEGKKKGGNGKRGRRWNIRICYRFDAVISL